MIINIKLLISVLVSTMGLFTYIEYIEKIELVINNKIIYTTTKSKMDDEYLEKIQQYQNNLIDESRSEVLRIENLYSDIIIFDEVESIKLIEVAQYKYIIEVIHNIERVEEEIVPFEIEEKKDDSKFVDYKAITTKGINGTNKKSYTVKYINGIESDIYNEKLNVIEPVKEIVVVGTKEMITSTNGNSNLNNGESSSNSNSGGSTAAESKHTGAFNGVSACMSYGASNSGQNRGYSCHDRDSDGWYDISFFNL